MTFLLVPLVVTGGIVCGIGDVSGQWVGKICKNNVLWSEKSLLEENGETRHYHDCTAAYGVC